MRYVLLLLPAVLVLHACSAAPTPAGQRDSLRRSAAPGARVLRADSPARTPMPVVRPDTAQQADMPIAKPPRNIQPK